MSITLIYR